MSLPEICRKRPAPGFFYTYIASHECSCLCADFLLWHLLIFQTSLRFAKVYQESKIIFSNLIYIVQKLSSSFFKRKICSKQSTKPVEGIKISLWCCKWFHSWFNKTFINSWICNVFICFNNYYKDYSILFLFVLIFSLNCHAFYKNNLIYWSTPLITLHIQTL